jgi:hypothetical protein
VQLSLPATKVPSEFSPDPKANSLGKALAPARSDFKNGEIVGGYAPTAFMNIDTRSKPRIAKKAKNEK